MSQHKAIHCYMLLTVWILLIVFGIYKFTETKENNLESIIKPMESFNNFKIDLKVQRILKVCNFPDNIERGNEGIGKKEAIFQIYILNIFFYFLGIINIKQLSLKGVLILMRHGDRGPLQHVKKLSLVNCGTDRSDMLNSYKVSVT